MSSVTTNTWISALRESIHEAGVRRGEETEKRVLASFELSRIGTPEWFIRIDRATHELDWDHGVDFIVQSDVGDLYLQIKSSAHWLEKFLAKQSSRRYNKFIAATFITEHMTPEEVCARIVRVLSEKRLELLAMRNGFTSARLASSAR